MSNQYTPGGFQGNPSDPYAEAIAREQASLKQALDHLAAIERSLETQRVQLQTQITYQNQQAILLNQAGRADLASEPLAKAAQLQPELAKIHEQMGRVVARQQEITSRQFDLLRQANAFGINQLPTVSGPSPYAGQPPYTYPQIPTPRKPRKRRRILVGLSIVLTMLVLVTLGLTLVNRPQPTAQQTNTTQAQANPTPTATPIISPTPVPQSHPYTPDGTGPTTQQCKRAIGDPCYSPEQIQQAFSLNALYKLGYDGRGQTIVILGVGNTTTLEADLKHFDQAWGLPDPPNFQIIQQAGPPTPYTCPDGMDDLAIESTLDVEWAHAMAPGANITVLIGDNQSPSGKKEDNCLFWRMESALNYAINNRLGQIITISYGGSELGGFDESDEDHLQDQDFYRRENAILSDAVDAGITILASTGDTGSTNPDGSDNGNGLWRKPNVSWPASSPYVLAVGGTDLDVRDANGTYGSERVWRDSGGGATGGGRSAYFAEPTYQFNVPNQSLFQGMRAIPDVSFPAEPFYDIYASFETGIMSRAGSQWKHWDIYGGTSISSPCWAGLIAIANQLHGTPVGFVQPALYRLRGKDMHDITIGSNSYNGVAGFSAQPGYDLATGWGTPIASQFLYDLVHEIDFPTLGCTGSAHNCS
jgi:subtilase family serine protease